MVTPQDAWLHAHQVRKRERILDTHLSIPASVSSPEQPTHWSFDVPPAVRCLLIYGWCFTPDI